MELGAPTLDQLYFFQKKKKMLNGPGFTEHFGWFNKLLSISIGPGSMERWILAH